MINNECLCGEHYKMRKINEAEVSKHDLKAIFNIAADLRDKPQSKWDKFLRKSAKDKIEVSDLQQAWQEAGYPDDIRDIESILKDFGFDKKEINKVFASAFGAGEEGKEYSSPLASLAITKIAEYAKEAGLTQDLIAFMQKTYGFNESQQFEGKAVVEDVRKIFTAIVQEERYALPEMKRQAEIKQLGRNKK